MDETEDDVLAFMSFPKSLPSRRRGTTGQRSTAPTPSNGSTVKSSAAPRSSASFPTRAPFNRPVGAILLEQNDEWAVQRASYMTLETMAPLSEDPIFKLPAVAA
jgi:hypothetical protein